MFSNLRTLILNPKIKLFSNRSPTFVHQQKYACFVIEIKELKESTN